MRQRYTCKSYSFDNVVNICPIIRLSREKTQILLHAVSSGDKVFKTIGPRSAMMKGCPYLDLHC